jgi:hypothetical protein
VALAVLAIMPSVSGPQDGGSPPSSLPGQSATVLSDGRVLVAGGLGLDGPVRAVAIVDPVSGTSTPLPPLSQARAWHTATVLPDGSLLVFGGVRPGGDVLAAPERIDLAAPNGASLSLPALKPRAHHTATVLTDGGVLLAGGIDDRGQIATHADLWQPRTGEVRTIGMYTPRADHSATLQPDGS